MDEEARWKGRYDLRVECLHFRFGDGADSDDEGASAVIRKKGP